MNGPIILTNEGFDKLKKELEYLRREKRLQVAERIKSAKEYGDLSENAEYHEAKEEQAFVEGRIMDLEHMIKTSQIAEKPHAAAISVGTKVNLDKDGNEVHYEIVGATEADPQAGKISLESPLGNALLGKKIGDTITIETPMGPLSYTIKKII